MCGELGVMPSPGKHSILVLTMEDAEVIGATDASLSQSATRGARSTPMSQTRPETCYLCSKSIPHTPGTSIVEVTLERDALHGRVSSLASVWQPSESSCLRSGGSSSRRWPSPGPRMGRTTAQPGLTDLRTLGGHEKVSVRRGPLG